jgi:Tfp pilus assembly protein PilN
VVGSLLAAGYMLTSSKVSASKATLRALQEELAAIPPRATTSEANAQLALQHDQRIAALGAALKARVAWDRILREISSILPEDVWLTKLAAISPQSPVAVAAPTTTSDAAPTETLGQSTTTPAPATTAPATPATTAPLTLSGYTYSHEGVARFLSRLAVIPELENVKLMQSSQTTVSGRAIVQFSIQADVREQVAT